MSVRPRSPEGLNTRLCGLGKPKPQTVLTGRGSGVVSGGVGRGTCAENGVGMEGDVTFWLSESCRRAAVANVNKCFFRWFCVWIVVRQEILRRKTALERK